MRGRWPFLAAAGAVAVVAGASLYAKREAVQFGDVTGWIGGFAAVAALILSLRVLSEQQKLTRRDLDERESRQANLVSCWVTMERVPLSPDMLGGQGTQVDKPFVKVLNASEAPIFDVVLWERPKGDPDERDLVALWMTIPPHEYRLAPWPDPPHERQHARPALQFADTAAIEWWRDGWELRRERDRSKRWAPRDIDFTRDAAAREGKSGEGP